MRASNISIDLSAPVTGKDTSWQKCVGSCHAALALRKDWCEYVKRVHDELGIQYVRFHGIFDDDMLTIQRLSDFIPLPYADKVTEISFRQVGKVYDNVLSTGMKPFVELSFLPSALASGRKTGLRYKNNITTPRSYKEWAGYIKAFIRFLLRRYGREEVESWYFEVWNEPDLKVFYTGSQQEYFKLYQYTARAIKECDPKLRVGGPSSSGSKWISEFVAFVEREKLPCDFISTHQYPGDGFGNDFSIKDVFLRYPETIKSAAKAKRGVADTITELFYDPDVVKKTPKGVMKQVVPNAKAKAAGYPLFYTEWNCTSVFGAPGHDEKYSAAYAVKTILDLKGETGCFSFWCCSDLYEEIMFINKPFHGGFGLLNNLGIPKPSFWALHALARTYDKRIKLPDSGSSPVEAATFSDGQRYQVFVYAQDPDPAADHEYSVTLELNRPVSGVKVMRIDDGHCNPKRVWQEMGSPMDPTPEQVRKIVEGSSPNWEDCGFQKTPDGCLIELTLRSNDVIELSVD